MSNDSNHSDDTETRGAAADASKKPAAENAIVREAPVRELRESAVVEMPTQDRVQQLSRGPASGPSRGRGPARGSERSRGRGWPAQEPEEDSGLSEKVVHINRCAKVVKGGRRFSFSALVVVGDNAGQVGVGYGKAKEVPESIRKGTEQAQKNMELVQLRGNTIPHEVIGEHDGGRVLLRPASPGTGVIAGGGVRAVLEACGIKDVLSKSLRSNNPGAVVFATLNALKKLRSMEQVRALRDAD